MKTIRNSLIQLSVLGGILFQLFSFVAQEIEANKLYAKLAQSGNSLPKKDILAKGIQGFIALKNQGEIKKNRLTVIDFRMSSNLKRMWVIDLDKGEILFHSLVAHGRNSGNEFAKYFGNKPQSFKSSLGFYITGNTYTGKHGLSLYLNGMEKGFNDNAKKRAIVMHGANYVSKDFIKKNGRLGRSYGCPSVPMKTHQLIINAIKGKSCLFLYYPEKKYEELSVLLRETD